MNLNFGEILTRAWQIIWKHKVLWIFGVLASCSRGGGSGGNGGGGNSGYNGGGDPQRFSSQMREALGWLQENWWVIALIALVLSLLWLALTALGFIGRVALIKGTRKAEDGAEKIPFGELFSESLPYFWRVFGLSFLIGLAFFIIIVPLVLVGVLTAGVGFLCLLPLLCVLIPIGIVLQLIVEQANAAIVLEDLSMVDGFKRGWQVTKDNVGAIIIMGLILGMGSFIIGIVIAIPIILAVLPLIIGAVAESMAVVWVSVACCALYAPIFIFLNGVLTAYIQTVWALTYLRLTAVQPQAPIIFEANA